MSIIIKGKVVEESYDYDKLERFVKTLTGETRLAGRPLKLKPITIKEIEYDIRNIKRLKELINTTYDRYKEICNVKKVIGYKTIKEINTIFACFRVGDIVYIDNNKYTIEKVEIKGEDIIYYTDGILETDNSNIDFDRILEIKNKKIKILDNTILHLKATLKDLKENSVENNFKDMVVLKVKF